MSRNDMSNVCYEKILYFVTSYSGDSKSQTNVQAINKKTLNTKLPED